MKIIAAKTAGFCFGVQRAIDFAYEMTKNDEYRGFVVGFGELIHNGAVISDLEDRGIVFKDDISLIQSNEKVIIRAHGVSRAAISSLEQKECHIFDYTCPYVKKIHKIVEEYHAKGYRILIIGDGKHPEVIGINGWCDNQGVVIAEIDEIDVDEIKILQVCVVAQTTFNKKKFCEIVNFIKSNCKLHMISDTICSATSKRQDETRELSLICDIMIVIGGKHSSNTLKLYEICVQNCKEVYLIENFEGLPQDINLRKKKIGITAGASTPSRIIEEVIGKMEEKEIYEVNDEEMSFAEAFEQSLKTLNTGDVAKGIVVEVRANEVIVDLGFKSDGIIPLSELTEDPNLSASDIVKVGDEIEVFVVGVNDAEGKTLLSRKKLDAIAGWKKIEESEKEGTILEGKVVQVVNGGMFVLTTGTKVFVPISHASDRYTQDLTQFVGKQVQYRILEINEKRRKVVGSVKLVLQEQNKVLEDKFWGDVEVGKKFNGVVKSITAFGAFVDLGGVDGLLHISEISWSRIKHPSDILTMGQMLEVYIKDVDKEAKKISLGFKKMEDNPWTVAKNKFVVGDVVNCKIVRMLPFGAFAELLPSVDGLIHISQISDKRIAQPSDCLTIGQEVEAQIVEADWDNRKISLSIRSLIPKEEKEVSAAEEKADDDNSYTEEMNVTIGDAMKIEE